MENNQTNQKLLAEIDRLKKELKKKKKYGLVWEDKPEDVVEMCKEKLPVLKEVKGKEIITDKNKPMNLLIEGDNYHALSVLNYTHKGKIDVIYIDPPYNTGNKDFKYNDAWVDKEDSYRHSKWLSFMEKRLKLAKNLLKDTGVIFISIDDNEQSNLKLACDQIFGEDNFVASLPRVTKKSGKQHSEDIGRNHDYVLIYTKNRYSSKFRGLISEDSKYKHSDEYEKDRGRHQLNQTLDYDSLFYNTTMDFPIEVDGETFLPGGDESKHNDRHNGKYNKMDWVWRWSIKKFEFGLANGFVVIKRGKNRPRIYTKTYSRVTIGKSINGYYVEYVERENNLSSLAFVDNQYSNDNAKKEAGAILGKNVFEYPKPSVLINTLLSVIDNKDGTVLDYFAGSGTTAHAVFELNKEDKGNRKFILCTNNENKICEEVTYPRVKKVIEGYKKNGNGEKVPGLGGNLKYFKTDFVDYKESTDRNKIKLTKEAVEMLCVKEGTFELVTENEEFKIFKNQDRYAGIIFDQLAIKDFKKTIKDIKGKISVYIFSLGDDSFEDEFEDIKQKVKLSPIPEAILKVYRRIFK